MTGPDLATKRDILRELQRSLREDPFFADLFGSRDTGFRAASAGVAVEAMSDISIEQIEWSWQGLCECLGVPVDSDVESVDDLLDLSECYPG